MPFKPESFVGFMSTTAEVLCTAWNTATSAAVWIREGLPSVQTTVTYLRIGQQHASGFLTWQNSTITSLFQRSGENSIRQHPAISWQASGPLPPAPSRGNSNARKIVGYKKNSTMSRRVDRNSKGCYGKTDDDDRIVDHAVRRVVIYYYILLAYWKQGCRIELDHTELQHGRSYVKDHNAAHSSILPNLRDNFYQQLVLQIQESGLTQSALQKIFSIGTEDEKIQILKQATKVDDMIQILSLNSQVPQRLLSSDSLLYNSMNATVEVPKLVNDIDCRLESALREEAINRLNEVSKGFLHPYEGLKFFVGQLTTFFTKLGEDILQRKKTLEELKVQEQAVKRSEKTFMSAPPSDQDRALSNYLKAVWVYRSLEKKINSDGSRLLGIEPNEEVKNHEAILKKMAAMVQEERDSIKMMNTLDEIRKYVTKLLSIKYKDLNKTDLQGHLIKSLQADKQEKAVENLNRFLYHCPPYEFLLEDGRHKKDLYSLASDELEKNGKWPTSTYEKTKEKLDSVYDIVTKQNEATQLPDYELLSGNYNNGKLIGHNDDELLKQRNSIVSDKSIENYCLLKPEQS